MRHRDGTAVAPVPTEFRHLAPDCNCMAPRRHHRRYCMAPMSELGTKININQPYQLLSDLGSRRCQIDCRESYCMPLDNNSLVDCLSYRRVQEHPARMLGQYIAVAFL